MGMKPMLADTADAARTNEYLNDDDWLMQDKADGQRYLVEMTDGSPMVWNRAGVPKVANLSHIILAQFEQAFPTGHWLFDGEYVATPDEHDVAGRLLLFDLPTAGETITPATPFEDRVLALDLLAAEWKPDPTHIRVLPTAKTAKAKLDMLHTADVNHREGVMLRHRLGIYEPGRRSARLLKHKFVKELDGIVRALGVADKWDADHFSVNGVKDNALICLLDPEREKPINVGVASTIGKKPTPAVGDVWTVRFLYVVDPQNPRLYQPRLMVKRDDKAYEECLFDQLQDAWTEKITGETKTREDM